MRASDEDALFCDFLEIYGLHGFGHLPVNEEAALAAGLPSTSRTMKKISGIKYTFTELLLASILDQLRISNWYKTKDAKKKRNFPKSIFDELVYGDAKQTEKRDDIETFETGEAFMRRLAQIQQGE